MQENQLGSSGQNTGEDTRTGRYVLGVRGVFSKSGASLWTFLGNELWELGCFTSCFSKWNVARVLFDSYLSQFWTKLVKQQLTPRAAVVGTGITCQRRCPHSLTTLVERIALGSGLGWATFVIGFWASPFPTLGLSVWSVKSEGIISEV